MRLQPLRRCLVGRGFILLRTGFFGGGMTSAVPPLAVIFSGGRLGEVVRLDGQLLGQFAGAQDADAVGRSLGQPDLLQRFGIDRRRRP